MLSLSASAFLLSLAALSSASAFSLAFLSSIIFCLAASASFASLLAISLARCAIFLCLSSSSFANSSAFLNGLVRCGGSFNLKFLSYISKSPLPIDCINELEPPVPNKSGNTPLPPVVFAPPLGKIEPVSNNPSKPFLASISILTKVSAPSAHALNAPANSEPKPVFIVIKILSNISKASPTFLNDSFVPSNVPFNLINSSFITGIFVPLMALPNISMAVAFLVIGFSIAAILARALRNNSSGLSVLI